MMMMIILSYRLEKEPKGHTTLESTRITGKFYGDSAGSGNTKVVFQQLGRLVFKTWYPLSAVAHRVLNLLVDTFFF